MMKLTTLLLLILPAVSAVRFGNGTGPDGGNALYDKDMHNHHWCCTDAKCVDSCNFFTPPMDPEGPVLNLDTSVRFNTPLWSWDRDGDGPAQAQTYTIWQVYTNNPPGLAVAFCEALFNYQCLRSSTVVGDPHFELWSGDWYDYHGEVSLRRQICSIDGFPSTFRTTHPGFFALSMNK